VIRPLIASLALALLAAPLTAPAEQPFLTSAQWIALRDAASGTAPYENLRYLTTLHRVPGTAPFDQAAEFMLNRAREYGLAEAHAEKFPIDGGDTHYGLMRSYLGWRVDFARLWEVSPDATLLGDYATDPVRLADYSHSAEVTSTLVDVGAGSSDADYAGKDVKGKIVLADGVLAEVQALAVMKYGAAGIVSDMPNQSTAWSGLDPSLVRWGHLNARAPQGFAFMVSRASATALRARLAQGPVTLKAAVKAEVSHGNWTVIVATIPGTDPKAGEIVYSCHLDHERPGANDNGSGCVTILESARLLNQAIGAGALPRPRRTLRFIWGPEVEGTMAYLATHPDIKKGLKADIHMDMVGGDPFKNKAMLHVTETPWSLPSFVTDVGWAFAEELRDGAEAYAENGTNADEAVVEDRNGAAGTRNVFLVDTTPYAEGSDHDDYDSSTIAVPSLYLRDWPDVYIHTDHDSLERIDATKLRRVALLGAASGYTFANLGPQSAAGAVPFVAARGMARLADTFARAQALANTGPDGPYEAKNLMSQSLQREREALRNLATFLGTSPDGRALKVLNDAEAAERAWLEGLAPGSKAPAWKSSADARRIPRRIGDFGPLNYQNDDVLEARLGSERVQKIKLLSGDSNRMLNAQEKGSLYAYEILNFVDGKRSVGDIRDAVAAEFGPLPLDVVMDFLKACEEAKVIELR
jgi:aminopeptidase YwaD